MTMSDDQNIEETTEADELEDPELDEWWNWGNFARLFIFPLIIVVVAVLIYGTFQYLLRDQRSVNDYIAQIQAGSESGRWRAAFDLAQRVQRQGMDRAFTEASAGAVIELYENAEDDRIKKYLSFVLANLPTSASVEALGEGLRHEDPGVRINASLALGMMKQNDLGEDIHRQIRERAPVIARLLEDDSHEVRRMSAFVLGSLGNTDIIPELEQTLNDNHAEVRWNGAIALGRLGSDRGQPVLMNVLEERIEGTLTDVDPELRINLVKNVIHALKVLETTEAVPLLETLRERDSNSSLRREAMEAVESIQS